MLEGVLRGVKGVLIKCVKGCCSIRHLEPQNPIEIPSGGNRGIRGC